MSAVIKFVFIFLRAFPGVVVAGYMFFVPSVSAEEANQQTYAVYSAIGHELDIVYHVQETGSSLDRNRHERVPIADLVFDRTAVQTISTVLKNAHIGMVDLSDQEIGARKSWANILAEDVQAVPEPLLSALNQSHADRLLLLIPYRGDAELQLMNRHTGSGKIQGLGFYIDRTLKVYDPSTGVHGRGYLGPYAYFSILLFDGKSKQLIRKKVLAASTTISQGFSRDADPWNALTSKQKVAALQNLIHQEIARVLPTILTP